MHIEILVSGFESLHGVLRKSQGRILFDSRSHDYLIVKANVDFVWNSSNCYLLLLTVALRVKKVKKCIVTASMVRWLPNPYLCNNKKSSTLESGSKVSASHLYYCTPTHTGMGERSTLKMIWATPIHFFLLLLNLLFDVDGGVDDPDVFRRWREFRAFSRRRRHRRRESGMRRRKRPSTPQQKPHRTLQLGRKILEA